MTEVTSFHCLTVHCFCAVLLICAGALIVHERLPAHIFCTLLKGELPLAPTDLGSYSAQVRRIELSRATASGAVAPEFVSELLAACELEGVAKLRCCEGMLPVWNADLFVRLDALRVLNLSNCALSALPPGVVL